MWWSKKLKLDQVWAVFFWGGVFWRVFRCVYLISLSSPNIHYCAILFYFTFVFICVLYTCMSYLRSEFGVLCFGVICPAYRSLLLPGATQLQCRPLLTQLHVLSTPVFSVQQRHLRQHRRLLHRRLLLFHAVQLCRIRRQRSVLYQGR